MIFRRRCPLGTVEQSMSWTARTAEVPLRQLVAVPVDVGKATAMLMVADLTPELAFLAGRDFEREMDKARRARRQFVREWAKITKKLDE